MLHELASEDGPLELCDAVSLDASTSMCRGRMGVSGKTRLYVDRVSSDAVDKREALRSIPIRLGRTSITRSDDARRRPVSPGGVNGRITGASSLDGDTARSGCSFGATLSIGKRFLTWTYGLPWWSPVHPLSTEE